MQPSNTRRWITFVPPTQTHAANVPTVVSPRRAERPHTAASGGHFFPTASQQVVGGSDPASAKGWRVPVRQSNDGSKLTAPGRAKRPEDPTGTTALSLSEKRPMASLLHRVDRTDCEHATAHVRALVREWPI